jgi:hypothetical protein
MNALIIVEFKHHMSEQTSDKWQVQHLKNHFVFPGCGHCDEDCLMQISSIQFPVLCKKHNNHS